MARRPPRTPTWGGLSRRPNYTSGIHIPVDEEGRFAKRVEFGRIYLFAAASGYAPVFLGPLEAEPGGTIENLRPVLERGFTGKIRLTDPQDRPIAQARLQTMHLYGEGGNGLHVAPREVITNDNGVAVLEHCAAYPLTVETQAAGFQHDRTELKLQPDAVVSWELKPARPTAGRVVSRQSGEPIAGAEVRLVHREGFLPRTHNPQSEYDNPPLLATTDQQGRFTLDTLRDDSVYALYIAAPGQGSEIVPNVRSGQAEVKVALGPPRYIRGKVTGDLSRLERRQVEGRSQPYVRCVNPLRLGRTAYHFTIFVPIEVRDGEGHFEIREPLFPGVVRLDFPGQARTLELVEAIDDVTINLPPPQPAPTPEPAPRRKVVLRFKTPAGEPDPKGELLVRIDPLGPGTAGEQKTLPVAGRQVEFEAPVPCRIRWETDRLLGYWIKEEFIQLSEAPGPLVKEIEAIPAGAVHGEVVNEDGSPCEAFTYSLVTVRPAPQAQNQYLGINLASVSQNRQGRFVVGPLPLEGTYRVEVHGHGQRAHTRAASEDLTLTRAAPIGHARLQLPEGVALVGRVLDPEGAPAAGIELRLGYRTAGRSHEGPAVRTGGEGEFRFPHVNPKLPGDYYLHLPPQESYRGQQAPWRPGEELLTIRLQHGWSLEGTLVEHTTGKVIPGATISARPAHHDQRYYLGAHEARSDARGRFRFETLEPIPYRFYASGVAADPSAPPWEADPRAQNEVILSGQVQRGADIAPIPPPSWEP